MDNTQSIKLSNGQNVWREKKIELINIRSKELGKEKITTIDMLLIIFLFEKFSAPTIQNTDGSLVWFKMSHLK